MTAPLTLGALLAHPDWAAVVVLAARTAGAEPDAVRAVHTVADLRADAPAARDALLAVALSGDRDDWHLDALLRRAAAAGVAAVLLPGTDPLRAASRLLAARVGVTVLGAPDPLGAALAATRLLHEPGQVLADLVSRTAAVCATVTGGVDELVAELARTWRRPVWLADGSGRVVAGTEPGPGDRGEVVSRPVGGERAHPTALVTALPRGVPAELAAVRAALGVAAGAVGQRMADVRLAVERDARLRMSLLAELVAAAAEPGPGTRRRALDAGWQLEGWHIGIRIDVPGSVDPVTTRPEVLRAFDAAHLRAVVVEQGSGWGAWSTFADEPGAGELNRHATATRRAQSLLRSTVPSAMGVGRLQRGAAGLARTLGEAGDAARLAATRSASGCFVHVDRLGLGQLLLAWTRTDTFLPAARSMLEPLRDQPGDLLRTLTAYLDAESSLTETAAVLGVHRNTVAARVARAQELLGVVLADPDERLALHLACRSVLFHT
ncbi:PucR family transcriptional regulator [Pseudonocardia kunmingensis]|uniref:PucR-like helix-turn-helix protein n=1 Tax=Pseudonocardia kunmingensis TaxID=630975 RepID=A0A543DVV8_9PSEU|nr:PucR family transcriptional regulator [Pseudonocardia kunmingensis]TQM13453.1 PucR-like helix-turn-helix protein [Pseudonocardia kunmingensis]